MGSVFKKLFCCEDQTNKNSHPLDYQTHSLFKDARKQINNKPVEYMYSLTDPNVQAETQSKFVHSLADIKINAASFIVKRSGMPSDFYDKMKILGEGSFGTVCQAFHKVSQEMRAMKIISKQCLSHGLTIDDIEAEINILKFLDHPNIMKIYEFFIDDANFYIVTEFCSEGSLFDKLEELTFLNEYIVKLIMFEIITAVCYLHSRNIIHGDLKLENIMIDKLELHHRASFRTSVLRDVDDINKFDIGGNIEHGSLKNISNFGIKLIDFGCSKIFSKTKKNFSDIVGTLNYCSPEVISNNYNEKSDMWSCGVIMYILLSGRMPFYGLNDEEVAKNILKGEVNFEEAPEFSKVSSIAKEFILELLTYDPKKRPSATESLANPFFQETFNVNGLLQSDIDSKNILNNLKNYSVKSKFHQAVISFITHNFAKKEEILNLRKTFSLIDKNKDGKLSKEELLESYNELGLNFGIKEIEALIKLVDSDNSGFVEYEEFISATINKKTLFTEINLKQAFDIFDNDHSGQISLDEIKSIIGKNLPQNVIDELLVEIGKKEDEEISFEDFKNLMNRLI